MIQWRENEKKILAAVGLGICLLILIGFCMVPRLRTQRVYLEYGEETKLDKNYLFTSSWLIQDLKVGPIQDAIGRYPVQISYRIGPYKSQKEIMIVIQDTTKPKIIQTNESIVLPTDSNVENLVSFFQVEDLTETTLEFKSEQVDWQTPGSYAAIAVASDAYGNTTKQRFTVELVKKKNYDQLMPILAKYGGKVGIYYKDLKTQEVYTYQDESFYPCSVIKLCVLVSVYDQVNQGNLDLEQCRPYLEPMIISSSNDAYNTLVRMIGQGDGPQGLKTVTATMKSLGLENTVLHHALSPGADFFRDGDANATTPSDMGKLLEVLYTGSLFSPEQNQEILDLLKRCEDTSALAQGLSSGDVLAHKSGWADGMYHDAGIIYGNQGDSILVIFTEGASATSSLFNEVTRFFLE